MFFFKTQFTPNHIAMKKTTLWIMLMLVGQLCFAQLHIPDTRVTFQFPNGGWKYLETQQVDENTTLYLYSYCAKTVTDSKGDTILPFLRIYVKQNYTGSIYNLIFSRSTKQPFQTLDEYMTGLPTSEGMGYVGAYNSYSDNKDYQFRMIYFKDKNTAFEFRAETTLDTYDAFDKEFHDIMQSIAIEK